MEPEQPQKVSGAAAIVEQEVKTDINKIIQQIIDGGNEASSLKQV